MARPKAFEGPRAMISVAVPVEVHAQLVELAKQRNQSLTSMARSVLIELAKHNQQPF